jgi:hypothetical protein
MERLRGGCSCGSVRFETNSPPLWVIACHCDACKKRTGSAFGVSFMFANESVEKFAGETKSFIRTGESGKRVRYEFCPDCGTTIRWHIEIVPGRQAFAGGTFDYFKDFKVLGEMYTDAAVPWARLGCELSQPGAPDDDFRAAMIENGKASR